MERLIFLFTFFFLGHLLFKRKDAFFFLRTIGIFLSIALVYYYIFHFFNIAPDVWDYNMFFGVILLIILLFRFLKTHSFKFLALSKKDFNLKSILGLGGMLLLVFFVSFWHFHWNFEAPNYVSIDAALHFSKLRSIVELGYTSNDVFGGGVSSYILANLFFFTPDFVEKILYDFQLTNTLIFGLIAAYFLLLFTKPLKIRSFWVLLLAFLFTAFSYFFNLFNLGFVPQMFGLIFLFLFLDFYQDRELNWKAKLIYLVLAFAALFFTYSLFWTALIMFFLVLDDLRRFLISDKKWRFFLVRLPVVLGVLVVVLLKIKFLKSMLILAGSEGEGYKVVLANLWPFLPLALVGIYAGLKEWKKDKTGLLSMIWASLLFSLVLGVLQFMGLASFYTFSKSFYLSGPLFILLFFFGLYWIQKRYPSIIVKLITGVYLGSLIFLISGFLFYAYKQKDPAFFHAKLVSSELSENVWNLKQRPLDIFRYNILLSRNWNNKVENFINFDQDKINFFRGLRPYLPEKYQDYYAFYDDFNRLRENRITMVADFKTSYWAFSLTKIWNRALDSKDVHDRMVVDYKAWIENYQEPYMIVLDTQTTNRWLWMNEKIFKWKNWEVVYQVGGNKLIRLKKAKND